MATLAEIDHRLAEVSRDLAAAEHDVTREVARDRIDFLLDRRNELTAQPVAPTLEPAP